MLYGIDYLRNKLSAHRTRIGVRYNYYDMKNAVRDFKISTPPELVWFTSALGWCAKSVDVLADRLSVKGVKNDNFDIEQIYKLNNPDILYDAAIKSAMICSCSFIYISEDEKGFPRLQVIDGGDATGIMDPITGFLTEGYAVLQRDAQGLPILEAYFVPGATYYYENGTAKNVYKNACAYPLLVPIIYRPDNKRKFGHSRISRACMDLQNSAIRTIKRSEIGAEFFAYPQKYVTGLSDDFEVDKWRASMSSMLMFSKDEEGDHPIIGQFQMQSMTPHVEQLRMFAALFAGEADLTLDDLGIASGNPSSADAIKSQHEGLRLKARKAQKTFGTGFINVGIAAASLRDSFAYNRDAFYDSAIAWEPVFEPDGSMLSGIGDALIKIEQAMPGYMTDEKLNEILGF